MTAEQLADVRYGCLLALIAAALLLAHAALDIAFSPHEPAPDFLPLTTPFPWR